MLLCTLFHFHELFRLQHFRVLLHTIISKRRETLKCCFPSDSQSYLVLPSALPNACRLLFQRLTTKREKMNFQSSRRRGEEGIAVVIDFLLSNARLVLGVGGAALLGIATLAVKRVSAF